MACPPGFGQFARLANLRGGPGLNLGLQDALNLGWKLAAQVDGWAPAGLLDTYQSERYPVGKRVILSTMSQAVLNGPGPQITALRSLFGELLDDEHNIQRIADLMAGTDVHYEMPGAVDHPMLGRWMPDLPLIGADGPTRIAELMRPGQGRPARSGLRYRVGRGGSWLAGSGPVGRDEVLGTGRNAGAGLVDPPGRLCRLGRHRRCPQWTEYGAEPVVRNAAAGLRSDTVNLRSNTVSHRPGTISHWSDTFSYQSGALS